MSKIDFGLVKSLFGGNKITPEEQDALFAEILVLTTARMARADSVVDDSELESVQKIVKEELGRDISKGEIRVAASSELYEMVSIDKHLKRIAGQLSADQRVRIVRSLSIVIRSDDNISNAETEFFDTIATALGATPSELIGLRP